MFRLYHSYLINVSISAGISDLVKLMNDNQISSIDRTLLTRMINYNYNS